MADTWDFLQDARRLVQGGDLCLVAVDYDHTASFLNHYGLHAVEAATRAAVTAIEEHVRLPGRGDCYSVAGWPDELNLACAGRPDDVLETIRSAVSRVPAAASCHLPPGAGPLRCTASVACQEYAGAAQGDSAIRALCRANEASLKDFKASQHLRGSAHPVPRTHYATLTEAPYEEIAAAVWAGMDADAEWSVEYHTRIARAHALPTLVLPS